MQSIVNALNDLLWGSVLIYLLLGTGLFFTLRLGFIQFRHFGHMFSVLKNSRTGDAAGISSFQALMTSLAARVGTGNLIGVATAIYFGGPGAVFWMWLVAMLGMATSFAESSLAQLYKVKDDEGAYRGGPAYYIEKGLGQRWLGVLFAISLIFCFGLAFNAVQANAIAGTMQVAFGIPTWVSGGAVALVTGLVIFGGIRSIARVAEIVVPFMAIAYILVGLFVLLANISELPGVFMLIIESAFGWREAGSGLLGFTIAQAMMNGVKRGLFSNEAGMGSAPNAAATARPYPHHPASQGYVQMLGVFIDTIVICTVTASIILLSEQFVPGSGIKGGELTQLALVEHVGDWGKAFIALALLFFAFTSIIANYSYGETNLVFLEHNHDRGLTIFRLIVLVMVFTGSQMKLETVFGMADVSMGIMAIINLIAILLLSGVVVKLARDYNRQLAAGQKPEFHSADYPELDDQLEQDIWQREQ